MDGEAADASPGRHLVPRWSSAQPSRRASLILGGVVAIFGIAQLAAMAVWSALGSAWSNASGLGDQPPFELLLKLGLAWQALLITPIIVGIGGALVSWLRRPLIGQALVVVGTACALAAAIPRIGIGRPNMLSLQQMVFPGGGMTAVPLCLALSLVAITVRDRQPGNVSAPSESSAWRSGT